MLWSLLSHIHLFSFSGMCIAVISPHVKFVFVKTPAPGCRSLGLQLGSGCIHLPARVQVWAKCMWAFARGGGGGAFGRKVGDFSVLAVFLKNVVP